MHYNTFPVIEQDPKEFEALVGKMATDVKVETMEPGDDQEISF